MCFDHPLLGKIVASNCPIHCDVSIASRLGIRRIVYRVMILTKYASLVIDSKEECCVSKMCPNMVAEEYPGIIIRCFQLMISFRSLTAYHCAVFAWKHSGDVSNANDLLSLFPNHQSPRLKIPMCVNASMLYISGAVNS